MLKYKNEEYNDIWSVGINPTRMPSIQRNAWDSSGKSMDPLNWPR